MTDTTIVLDTRKLDAIVNGLDTSRTALGRAIAFEIEAQAKQNAPVDTSALRNSIYTVTTEQDNYTEAAANAEGAKPNVRTEPHPPLTGDEIARVGPCVEYAAFVEFPGRVLRGGRRPYLLPAVESVFRKVSDLAKRYMELEK